MENQQSIQQESIAPEELLHFMVTRAEDINEDFSEVATRMGFRTDFNKGYLYAIEHIKEYIEQTCGLKY